MVEIGEKDSIKDICLSLDLLRVGLDLHTWGGGRFRLHLEPRGFLVQEPQVANPNSKVEKTKNL